MAILIEKLRELVEARADGRCEYCRRYQEILGNSFFEVEHILPRSRGGLTIPANLAFACRRCNLFKGAIVQVIDPRTKRIVSVFHPRRDHWHDHFRRSVDQIRIYGRTAVGRATVALLRLNDRSEQRTRQIQRDYLASSFPFD